jgi:hypothetical protein
MHDRENACTGEIALFFFAVVGEQAAHPRGTLKKAARRSRRNHGVNLTRQQHVAQSQIRPCFNANPARQPVANRIATPGLINPRLNPFDGVQRHADIVHQPASHVHGRGLRPLRDADRTPGQIARVTNAGRVLDVDGTMPEHSRREYRQCHYRRWLRRGKAGTIVRQ